MGLIIIIGDEGIFSLGEGVGIIRECCSEEVIKREKLENHSFVCALLPLGKGERKNDMVALLKERVFRDLVSDLKTKQKEEGGTRGELIKLIGGYAKHLEIVGTECDMLVRAKAEGDLLESVLRLLALDQFDPLGCIILAQRDRGLQVDQVSSLLQVDID